MVRILLLENGHFIGVSSPVAFAYLPGRIMMINYIINCYELGLTQFKFGVDPIPQLSLTLS